MARRRMPRRDAYRAPPVIVTRFPSPDIYIGIILSTGFVEGEIHPGACPHISLRAVCRCAIVPAHTHPAGDSRSFPQKAAANTLSKLPVASRGRLPFIVITFAVVIVPQFQTGQINSVDIFKPDSNAHTALSLR